jgi:DNA-binding transcriptional LysR family regulator
MKPEFTLKQLHYFTVVADGLHFGRAAEQLHMTQPALSRQIAALEQRLDVVLLERHRHVVGLTPAGRQFLHDARSILTSIETATSALQHLRARGQPHNRPVLRCGYTLALDASVFPDLRLALKKLGSGHEVELSFARSAELIKQVRQGRLEIAFIGMPASVAGVASVRLGADPMAVAVPQAHPLARRKLLGLAELSADAVFWFKRSRNPAFFDHAQRVFAEFHCSPQWLAEPEQHHLLLGEVARGNGIGLVPRSMTRSGREGVRFVALREGGRLAVETGVVWRPDPTTDALVAAVRALAAAP